MVVRQSVIVIVMIQMGDLSVMARQSVIVILIDDLGVGLGMGLGDGVGLVPFLFLLLVWNLGDIAHYRPLKLSLSLSVNLIDDLSVVVRQSVEVRQSIIVIQIDDLSMVVRQSMGVRQIVIQTDDLVVAVLACHFC
jgi:hypothetical protein